MGGGGLFDRIAKNEKHHEYANTIARYAEEPRENRNSIGNPTGRVPGGSTNCPERVGGAV